MVPAASCLSASRFPLSFRRRIGGKDPANLEFIAAPEHPTGVRGCRNAFPVCIRFRCAGAAEETDFHPVFIVSDVSSRKEFTCWKAGCSISTHEPEIRIKK
jgi:hypothetical protein